MTAPGGPGYAEDIESIVHIGQVSALALISSIDQQGDGKNGRRMQDWILVGMGSQVFVFRIPPTHNNDDVANKSVALPYAVHVHGIASAACMDSQSTVVGVYGDRYLALLLFDRDTGALKFLTQLPRCSHWIMCLELQIRPESIACQDLCFLAYVGLSDNSVEVYDVSVLHAHQHDYNNALTSKLLYRVGCEDRCLLYSMELLTLQKDESTAQQEHFVAGGTVFLDVVVWSWSITDVEGDDSWCDSCSRPILYRLKGHEGSIHCVRWGPPPLAGDAIRLASGSDDRTLRIWTVPLVNMQTNPVKKCCEKCLSADKVLYGHTGRLWGTWFWEDIFSDGSSLIVTASEDGTCRFWDIQQGICLFTLQTHKFRGAWQCLLYKGMFFTAGADAAIKAWSLVDIFPQKVKALDYSETTASSITYTLQRVLPMPDEVQVGTPAMCFRPAYTGINSYGEQMLCSGSHPDGIKKSAKVPAPRFDSTAEWIRDLAILDTEEGDKSTLFISTNRGILHRVDLTWASSGIDRPARCIEEEWRTLYVSPNGKPLCTVNAVHHTDPLSQSKPTLVVGACSITGLSVVLHLDADSHPQAYEWHPCMTGLSIFFPFETRHSMSVVCPEGSTMKFAAVVVGPRGEIGIYGIDFLDMDGSPTDADPLLLMSAVCPLGNRITYVSSSECAVNGQVLLVTGTSTGGITVWSVGGQDCNGQLYALQTFAHAHEATPVRFLSKPVLREGPVCAFNFESAGSNGTIQKFAFYYNTAYNACRLARRGENKCDDLLIIVGFSTANALHANQEYFNAEACLEYCWGFKGTKFGVWREEEEIEVCSITCGSWRRPWAVSHTGLYVNHKNPDSYNNHASHGATLTFCFDSGGRHVTVYRRTLSSTSASGQLQRPECSLPTSLSFSPFHGREINALAIVSNGVSPSKDDVMVVTGGEDATVRGTFVRIPIVRQLYRSILIGEHAGGTAVKSMALTAMFNKFGVNGDDQKYLLVTAGSKRVLMAWTITKRPASAEWISSHVQEQVLHRKSWSNGQRGSNNNASNNSADIRYVAVDVYYRSSTEEAFVIAATSTGEMEVLRLGTSTADRQITFCQSWISILRLVHHTTPVLSLRCLELDEQEDEQDGDDQRMIIVISGGTDGSLVVWSITQSDLTREIGDNVEMHPLTIIPSIHQSGVNDLTIVTVARLSDSQFSSKAYKSAVLVVSAGDDQSIAVTMLGMNMHPTPNVGHTRPVVNVLGSAVRKNAHASAVRGIWADDMGTMFSVGLDQRVRRWRVCLSNNPLGGGDQGITAPSSRPVAIEEVGSAFTQVLEPSSIGVEVREGAAYGMRCYVIAVAGRGMEIIRWPEPTFA